MSTNFFPTLIILSLIFSVPPQKPLIVDDRGRTVEGEMGIGPFREGESLSLECNVPGGKKFFYTFSRDAKIFEKTNLKLCSLVN